MVELCISDSSTTAETLEVTTPQLTTDSVTTPVMTTPVMTTATPDLPSPNISTSALTATSVTVSWTPPQSAPQVVEYAVALERVTGPAQVLCPSFEDSRPAVTVSPDVTSMQFTGLQEYSVYTVTVTARYSGSEGSASLQFTTLSAS